MAKTLTPDPKAKMIDRPDSLNGDCWDWKTESISNNKRTKKLIQQHGEEEARKIIFRSDAHLLANSSLRKPVKLKVVPESKPQLPPKIQITASNRRRCASDSDDEGPTRYSPGKTQAKRKVNKRVTPNAPHQSIGQAAERHDAALSTTAAQQALQPQDTATDSNRVSYWPGSQQDLPRQEARQASNIRLASKQSLVTRTEPRPSQHRTPRLHLRESAFLSRLPGEIRNIIYAYVIDEPRVLICATKPKDEVAEALKLWENDGKHIKQPRSRLYPILDILQAKQGLQVHASAALLLVNKQIKEEAEYHLFSSTKFCFPNLKVLGRFLEEAPASGVRAIRSIELEMQCYGEPKEHGFQEFKKRSDARWQAVCERLSAQMLELQSLKIYAGLSEWPLSDIRRTSWYQSLMKIVSRQQLREVKIHIAHPRFKDRKLEEIASKIESDMMSEKGMQERERRINFEHMRRVDAAVAAEKERLAQLPLRTDRILRIVIDKPQKSKHAENDELKASNACISTQLATYQANHKQITAIKVPGRRANRYDTTGKKWRHKHGGGQPVGVTHY